MLVLLIFLAFPGRPQLITFPDGIYQSLKQLRSQKPAFAVNLVTIHRSSLAKGMFGGNNYTFKSKLDSINNRFFKDKIYACVKNDSVFLNLSNSLGGDYALSLTHGYFLAFYSSVWYSYAGQKKDINRNLYVLDLVTGNAVPLDWPYVEFYLKDYPQLLEKYRSEKIPDSELTLIKYIDLLNEIKQIGPSVPGND